MSLWRNIQAVTVAVLLGMLALPQARADEAWVRVDRPDAAVRAQLPAEAIDYGAFIWMPERVLPAAARSTASVHRIERPFAMPIDGQARDLADWPAAAAGRISEDQDQARFHLIQFRGPLREGWLDKLRDRGLEPVQFIAPNAYLVWGLEEQLPHANARSVDPVRFAGRPPDSARLNPLQRTPEAHHHARAMIYRPVAHEVLTAMREAGAAVRDWRSAGGELLVVDLQIAPERFPDLLAIAGVLTVQQVSQDAGPRGELANQSVVTLAAPGQTLEPAYRAWLDTLGLDGSGVVVAVVDGGILQTHQDLAGQFLDCVPGPNLPTSCSQDNDNHGTHVAAAIAGSGASGAVLGGFLRGLGMAPGARLVQQRYPPLLAAGAGGMVPGGMLTIFAESALSGAVLANNSWGPSTTPQGYDIPSRAVDLITRNALPEAVTPAPILPVWSIMNGNGDDPNSVCAPSSLGAPDEAKNLLSVGSSVLQAGNGSLQPNPFDISSNSAHGPACDGRQVPQLIAPGCSTDNPIASSDSAYSASFCGTSMASPIVTGTAALFVEQYRNNHGGVTPSPALIKARLTAGARDLQGFRDADFRTLGHRPDRMQGWGRLDAKPVLQPDQDVFLLDQTRIFNTTGQAWTGRFTPSDPSVPMHIMLAWTDAPGHGLGGAMPAWVNDLDLIVHRQESSYYGNGFGSDGFSVTGTSPDPRNNLEGVVLAADQHQGEAVRVEVLAANLAADAIDPWTPGGPAQDFALVCVNCQQAPDFTLDLAPQAIRACLDDGPLQVEAMVRSVLGFDQEVSLTAQSLDGFNGALGFDGSAQVPDFSRMLSIETNAAQAGAYRILIEGSASNADSIASTLGLALDAPLATGPAAVSPLPSGPVSVASGFAWTALDGAQLYRFELARDPDFNLLVEDRVVEHPSWQPQNWLAPNSTYFWRVRGENACGEGVVSDTFVLETDAGPATALAFVSPPELDGEGGFLGSIEIEIRDADGNRMTAINEGLIELNLAEAADGTTLTGTLARQVSAGLATFDDLGISSEFDGEFRLHATLSANETLEIEAFSLGTLQTLQRQAAAGLASDSPVTGLAFSGTVSGISASPSFASDLRLAVIAPDGSSASLGGFQTASDQPWSFNGPNSGSDGSYQSEHQTLFSDPGGPVDDEGFWQFEFRNDFSGGELMSWDNVRITLVKQPLEILSGTISIRGSRIYQDRFELD